MCHFFAEFIYFVWKALGGLTIWTGVRVILRSMKVLLFDRLKFVDFWCRSNKR